MMKLEKLIEHHEKRRLDCAAEIDRCLAMFKANSQFTEDACKRCVETWREEHNTARDTVSYLKTLEKMKNGY
jgi:hypothetical protein